MKTSIPADRPGRTRARMLGVSLAALLVAGCGGVQPYGGTAADFPVATRFAAGYAEQQPRLVDSGWLRSFRSQELYDLVNEALVNNRDLRIAAARLEESRARARQAGGTALPGVGATLRADRQQDADTRFDLGLDVSWEADIWGRLSGARTAAQLDAVAENALYNAVRQSIAAQVADQWLVISGNQVLADVARREVSIRRSFLNDVSARVAEQTALQVDANRARADLSLAQQRVAVAEGRIGASKRALEVLLGRYPAGTLQTRGALPPLPARPATGVPSQLLERRPDVVAAERAVAAAFYRRSEAQAAQLPRLVLNAGLSGPGQSLGDALDPDNIVWGIVGNIIAPIFAGGQLAEEVNVNTARQAAALANYGNTALVAFREVEDALAAEQVLSRELGSLSEAERELAVAIRLEDERYRAGETIQSDVSGLRLTYYNVQRAQVEAQVERLRNRVRLHLALGGSFDVPAPAAVAAPAVAVVAQAN